MGFHSAFKGLTTWETSLGIHSVAGWLGHTGSVNVPEKNFLRRPGESKFFSVHKFRFPKEHCFLEGSQVPPACPHKGRIEMTMSVEHWWSDTDRRQQ